MLLLIGLCLAGILSLQAQTSLDSLLKKIDPQKWSAAIEKKLDRLEEKIISQTAKTLDRFQKREEKAWKKKLLTKDSIAAKEKLAEVRSKYSGLRERLNDPASFSGTAKKYLPHLDSLTTAFKFLDKNGAATGNVLSRIESFETKMQGAEEARKFLLERREQLRQELEKLGDLKELKKINKEVYYYSEQLKEYRSILNDPDKIEKKAIGLLSRTRLFQDFFKKNSMLASLFRMPGDPNDPAYIASLAGLQTRSQVSNLIQRQITSGGPSAQAAFRNNIQQAQSQLQQLKDKLGNVGSGSSDDIMPEGFKPNSQKTRSFFKRFEWGTNIQTQRSTSFFPVTSDLGLSLGYKLNDKSVVGVGASYKLGWGPNFRNIQLSNQGAGLRSYADWKLKGSLWISGGYEMNYKTAFSNISQLQNLNAWQQSGLIGLSKVVSIKSKFFKKTKLQLLWDFLSYRQTPQTQPIVFRIGYNFK
jgi:hypothetical protein